jgi:peroxiredoxin Q/BCP
VRELREFRVHHVGLQSAGIEVAGVSLDPTETQRVWAGRLGLDTEREAGEAFGVLRRIGIGTFTIELFRRSTFLVDAHGVVRAVWEKVRIRGHALEVLDVARGLGAMTG